MATSSILGVDSYSLPPVHSATGIDSLGPSDASDSGSDSMGVYSAEPDSDTDRHGTGERGSVEQADEPSARDILPDHVESVDELAGNRDATQGRGLDEDGGEGLDGDDSSGAQRVPRRGDTNRVRADDLPQDEEDANPLDPDDPDTQAERG